MRRCCSGSVRRGNHSIAAVVGAVHQRHCSVLFCAASSVEGSLCRCVDTLGAASRAGHPSAALVLAAHEQAALRGQRLYHRLLTAIPDDLLLPAALHQHLLHCSLQAANPARPSKASWGQQNAAESSPLAAAGAMATPLHLRAPAVAAASLKRPQPAGGSGSF